MNRSSAEKTKWGPGHTTDKDKNTDMQTKFLRILSPVRKRFPKKKSCDWGLTSSLSDARTALFFFEEVADGCALWA